MNIRLCRRLGRSGMSQVVRILSTIAGGVLMLLAKNAGADTLYVSNPQNYSIEQFTSNGVASTFVGGNGYGNPLIEPYGLAFDSAGNLYEADGSANRIEKITPGGVVSVFATNGLGLPRGLAFDSAGNLYAANWGSRTIEKFTPNGVGTVFASTGLNAPNDLAFDSAGNLYVASGGNNTIVKFTPNGVGTVFASLITPVGLAFDAAGNLYVANEGWIEKYTPNGVGTVFASTGLDGPWGLAFDSAGNLYAVNELNNTIEEFAPNGVGTLFASTGLAEPTDIAIKPGLTIPEPSTWQLVSLGVAALVASRRLRWRSWRLS